MRAIVFCACLICISVVPNAMLAAESFSFNSELPALLSSKAASTHRLSVNSESGLSVILFLSPDCPASVAHEPYLEKLRAEYSFAKFSAIYSGSNETLPKVRAHFNSANLNFPVLHDRHGELRRKFKVLKTPTVVVLRGPRREYFGGVTDSHRPDRAGIEYLRAALEDLKDGRTVATPQGHTLGCYIGS